jgi:tetratricopeptide (TPR) repeat protein
MARVDRRRAAREARNARAAGGRRPAKRGRSRGSASSIESTLFFTRLRTQAKWAFAVMVIVFGAGFAFLGVGSGGLDLGQMIRDTFGAKGGGGGTSISAAQKRVNEHPREAKAYKTLTDALERKGRTDEAITALEQYTRLAPKDAGQLARLGRLEFAQADAAATEANAAYTEQQTVYAGSTFGPSPSSKLGQALGSDPITQAVSTKVSTRVQEATTKYSTASAKTIATFQKLTKLKPGQDSYFNLAQAAEHFQNNKVALSAYRSLLKVEKDTATRARIRAKIASLQASLKNRGG